MRYRPHPGRQHPQVPGALDRRGSVAGVELGVDVATWVLTVFTETNSSAAISDRERFVGR
jgi:hypothetical protein